MTRETRSVLMLGILRFRFAGRSCHLPTCLARLTERLCDSLTALSLPRIRRTRNLLPDNGEKPLKPPRIRTNCITFRRRIEEMSLIRGRDGEWQAATICNRGYAGST